METIVDLIAWVDVCLLKWRVRRHSQALQPALHPALAHLATFVELALEQACSPTSWARQLSLAAYGLDAYQGANMAPKLKS
jgi:hypothetical protein